MDSAAAGCIIVLEDFEGPLQLLLHLINREEMDIENLPMARVAAQYLDFIVFMDELNIDLAAEFLVMAAELLRIKSRLVLPVEEAAVESLEQDDPRAELVRRLKEYSAFKDAAGKLSQRRELWEGVHTRPPMELEILKTEHRPPLEGLSFFELIDAFRRVLETADEDDDEDIARVIEREPRTVARSIRSIVGRLRREGGKVSFMSLFGEQPSRREIVVTLLALLELIRDGIVQARQQQRFGDIEIVAIQVMNNA